MRYERKFSNLKKFEEIQEFERRWQIVTWAEKIQHADNRNPWRRKLKEEQNKKKNTKNDN